jgi:hypothetical protein
VEKEFKVSVERPKDALPGRGGVRVTLRPKIVDGLNGVLEYMRWYPYGCMEQKISVAVALRDENLWKRCMSELPSHLDSDGLVKYFPLCIYGSPVLTSYIIAIGDEAGWTIPDETKGRMEKGLRRFIEGSIIRYSPLPTADLSIRKLTAVEALSRLHLHRAQPLADLCGDRLVQYPEQCSVPPESGGTGKRSRTDHPVSPQFSGDSDGIFNREDRLFMVADGLERSQCRSSRPLTSPLGKMESGYAEIGSGSLGPAEEREMGPDPGQCLGGSGRGEVFQGF